MLITPNMSRRDITLKAVDEIFVGPASTASKIAALIVIRRDNHGDEEIQGKCNTYLDFLYELKYINLEATDVI